MLADLRAGKRHILQTECYVSLDCAPDELVIWILEDDADRNRIFMFKIAYIIASVGLAQSRYHLQQE
jgi:hypothetical protein